MKFKTKCPQIECGYINSIETLQTNYIGSHIFASCKKCNKRFEYRFPKNENVIASNHDWKSDTWSEEIVETKNET